MVQKSSSKPNIPNLPKGSDRKSTRLNSSHPSISYAVFCLKKKICTDWTAHRGTRAPVRSLLGAGRGGSAPPQTLLGGEKPKVADDYALVDRLHEPRPPRGE